MRLIRHQLKDLLYTMNIKLTEFMEKEVEDNNNYEDEAHKAFYSENL